jgi:hypothetical protein
MSSRIRGNEERQKMNKTSNVAAVAIGIMTLVTGTYALGASRNATPSAVATTNGSDVTLMPGTGTTLRLHFSGVEIITHDSHGGLMILKARGQMLHYRPEAYQVINGEIKPVEVNFRIEGMDQVVVQFGNIDKNAPVILKQGAVMSGQPSLM